MDITDELENSFLKIGLLVCVIIGAIEFVLYIGHVDDIQGRNKVPAGHLLKIDVINKWFSDTSVLYLTDGTVVKVNGSVSKWQKGMTITHPAPDGSANDNSALYWCVDDTCLKQL